MIGDLRLTRGLSSRLELYKYRHGGPGKAVEEIYDFKM